MLWNREAGICLKVNVTNGNAASRSRKKNRNRNEQIKAIKMSRRLTSEKPNKRAHPTWQTGSQ